MLMHCKHEILYISTAFYGRGGKCFGYEPARLVLVWKCQECGHSKVY